MGKDMRIKLEVESYVYPQRGRRYRVVPRIDRDSPIWDELKKYFSSQTDWSGRDTDFGAYLLRQEMRGNLSAKLLMQVLRELPDASREMASLYEYDNDVDRRKQYARGKASGLKTASRVLKFARLVGDRASVHVKTVLSQCNCWTGNQPYYYVYFLIDKGMCVYVGQAKELKSRLASHGDKQYDCVRYILVKPEYVDAVESAFIHKYKPKYNKSNGNSQGIPFSLWYYECQETSLAIQKAIREVFRLHKEFDDMDSCERVQKSSGRRIVVR